MAVAITSISATYLPKLRFIGKRCMCEPKDFVAAWDEWLAEGLFTRLEKLGVAPENGDSYLGMTAESGGSYWIGLLFPPDTQAPDGFEYEDIAASRYALISLEGKKDGELLNENGAALCFKEMEKRGLTHNAEGQDFEHYKRPSPDGKGRTLIKCLFAIR